jgi:hypothetical protein
VALKPIKKGFLSKLAEIDGPLPPDANQREKLKESKFSIPEESKATKRSDFVDLKPIKKGLLSSL